MSRQGTPKALIILVGLLALGLAAPGSASAAPTATTSPSIQGPSPPYVGDVLQGNDGVYRGGTQDPSGAVIQGSEWFRCEGMTCTPTGVTSNMFTLTSADLGKTILYRQRVTCSTPVECSPQPFDSNPTAVVQDPAPAITALSVSRSGRTLTADRTVTGRAPVSVSYRWRRCNSADPNDCQDLPGSAGAGQTFKLTSADIGRRLRVRVSASNSSGSVDQLSVPPTEVIAAAPPTPTSPPVVSGKAREGSTLTSTLGTWSGEGPISYSRNWVRCSGTATSSCTAIPPGATLATYKATAADVGKRLRVGVRAEGLGSRVAFTAATAVVGAIDFSYPEPPAPAPSPDLLTPFPRIAIAGRARRSSTLITKFVVRAPRGSRVTIRCRGRGCPFRRASARAGRRAVRFRRLQRAFRTGTVIEVFVTSRGKIGKYARFRFRRRRAPSRADGCLNPGAKKPTPCPQR